MSIAHAVLSATIPLYESICFFVMREKDYNPGMEPKEGPQVPPVTPLPPVPPVPPVPEAEPVQSDDGKKTEKQE